MLYLPLSFMDSASRSEGVKPMLLKAGIPLAISIAAIIGAKIFARRSLVLEAPSTIREQVTNSVKSDSCDDLIDEESNRSVDSTSEETTTSTDFTNSNLDSQNRDKFGYEQEILGFRRQIEELEKRELETRMKFARYRDLKEQESKLMETKYTLLLEIAYVEFLSREVSSMEEESKRLENVTVECLRTLEQVEYWKSQSGLLRRQVKKLLKKTTMQSRAIREKNLKIEAAEAESLRKSIKLEEMSNELKKLEDELREPESVVHQLDLDEEKTEESAASTSKVEDEGITMEDYKQVLDEKEELRVARASEVKEVIYLRWINACLRFELARNRDHWQVEQNQEETNNNVNIMGSVSEEIQEFGIEEEQLEHQVQLGNHETRSHGCSKKRRLIRKLKKWVDGNGSDQKEKHEIKCFGRHSVCDETEDDQHLILARKSCSSV